MQRRLSAGGAVVEPESIAVDAFVRQYAGFVRALLSRDLRAADVDDLAQEVFIAVLTNRSKRGGEAIVEASPQVQRAWLYQAVRYELADSHRSSSRASEREKRYANLAGRGDTVDDYDLGDDVMLQARAQLSDSDNEILAARYIDGLSNQELALAEGVSEDSIRQRLSRALRRLRDAYTAVVGGEP